MSYCYQCKLYKAEVIKWRDLAIKYSTSLKDQQMLLDLIDSEKEMNAILTVEIERIKSAENYR